MKSRIRIVTLIVRENEYKDSGNFINVINTQLGEAGIEVICQEQFPVGPWTLRQIAKDML